MEVGQFNLRRQMCIPSLCQSKSFVLNSGEMGVPHVVGNLKDSEEFDITLFGIPRKLIEITDPTTRVSIMQGFRAVCDAGVNPNEISGSNTAVIMSSFTSETEDEYLTQNANLGTYGIIANARAMQANR